VRLNTVDAWSTRLSLSVVEWSGRLSWRLATTLRTRTAALHEAVLLAARSVRIPYVPLAWIDSSLSIDSEALPNLYPAPLPLREDAERCLAGLRAGTWAPDGGDPILLDGTGWSAAEEIDRSMFVRFLWHALHPVALLLEGHRAQGGAGDLARALALAERWIRTCLYREREETIWDDHITAMRALVLCDLWNALRRDGGERGGELRSLGTALARHGEKLALERFYRPGHNHGITQALGLLAAATALRGHPSAERWRRLGCRRIEGQMQANVSPEGVHREHSPYYHFFVLRQFHTGEQIARAAGTPLTAGYRERFRRMLEAGASMFAPDGTLVALGDTWHGAPILLTPEEIAGMPPEATSALRFARSSGSEGEPSGSALYRDGGLAVLRSGAATGESPREERHITVRLTVHPTSHIHADALALTLYAYGAALLIDSGGPYGYGTPLRDRYFTTTAAHNTVSVDSGSQSPGPCLVHRWDPSPGCALLEAEHENYRGVLHRRTVYLVRGRYVVLLDRLSSPAAHRYAQIFHFAPDLRVEPDGRGALARRGADGPSLRVVPLLPFDAAAALDRGGEDPPRGWVCTGDLQREPTWVASIGAEAERAVFATLLLPAPGASPPRPAAARSAGEVDGEAVIDIVVEGTRLRLRVPPDAAPQLEAGDA
jgi:uncharacterized heparinase superfamily protein